MPNTARQIEAIKWITFGKRGRKKSGTFGQTRKPEIHFMVGGSTGSATRRAFSRISKISWFPLKKMKNIENLNLKRAQFCLFLAYSGISHQIYEIPKLGLSIRATIEPLIRTILGDW